MADRVPIIAHKLPAEPLAQLIRARAEHHEGGLNGLARDIQARVGGNWRSHRRTLLRLAKAPFVTERVADRIITALHEDPFSVFGYGWTGSLEVAG